MKLLADHCVEYLVVGGYAVGHHGYPRTTGDMDVWVRSTPDNAERLVEALHAFGFGVPSLVPDLFMAPDSLVRMGIPPDRIELMTTISGVEFGPCWDRKEVDVWQGVPVYVLSLADLKINKRASGRPKDLLDLEELP